MKKISLTILLALFTVSIFAQSGDLGFTFGKKIGIMLSYSPKKMKGYGIFIDYKGIDMSSDLDIKSVEKTVLSRDEYYTWQTNYGSYTKEIYEKGTMLHQKVYTNNTSLSMGITIPTNKDNFRFLIGGGINIKKFKTESFLDYYASVSEHTYYATMNYHDHDYSIGSIRIEDIPDKVNYEIQPNITYGFIWGSGVTLNAGFDTKFYPDGMRTEIYIGFGLH